MSENTVDPDPLEKHLLEALRALEPSVALRSAPPEVEEIWRAQVDSRQADYAARWLQQHGRSFYTIGSAGHESNAAVALALRVDDPALLHYRSGAFYLARASQAEIDGLRDILLGVVARSGRADRRRPAQGLRPQGARRHPHDVDDRVAPARVPSGWRFAIDRAAAPRRASPWQRRRDRPVLVRRRVAQPRDGAGGAEHHGADLVPGPAAAAALRVRGQRARASACRPRRAGSSPRSPPASRSATRSRTGTILPRCSA